MRAVITGYEVSNRIASVMVPAHYDFWHTTATVGFFGATASSSYTLGLNASQTAHALATSASMAPGLRKEAFRSDAMTNQFMPVERWEGGKSWQIAFAKEGITGALDIFEADRGFGRAMSDSVDWKADCEGPLVLILPLSKLHKKTTRHAGMYTLSSMLLIRLRRKKIFILKKLKRLI